MGHQVSRTPSTRAMWSRCALTAARPRRREVEALEASLGDKVMALDGRVGALQATSLAAAEKTYAKGATAAEVNAELCELQTYARGEAAACVLDLRKIERFITLHVPKVEDGNNFGVAIQLEVAKLVKETGKECKGLLDALPAYHKDRAALLEKVVARTTTETSESKSSSNDEEKGTEAKTTAKSGTASSSTTKTSSSKPLPDAVAAVAQLDVQHRFALIFLLEVVRDAYIAVGDCLEKNKGKLVAPKGEGGNAMSMF